MPVPPWHTSRPILADFPLETSKALKGKCHCVLGDLRGIIVYSTFGNAVTLGERHNAMQPVSIGDRLGSEVLCAASLRLAAGAILHLRAVQGSEELLVHH